MNKRIEGALMIVACVGILLWTIWGCDDKRDDGHLNYFVAGIVESYLNDAGYVEEDGITIVAENKDTNETIVDVTVHIGNEKWYVVFPLKSIDDYRKVSYPAELGMYFYETKEERKQLIEMIKEEGDW